MLRDEDMLVSIAEQIRGVGDCRARGEPRGNLGGPTTAHRWPQHYGLSGCCTGVEWSARPARRHCPIPVRPRNAGCDSGPLMVGACAGAESGAGIRFSNGACGVGGAKRVVGSVALMSRPAPRAELGEASALTASPKAS